MDFAVNLLFFLLSIAVIWFFSGLLIDAVDRTAKRFNKSGFTVAFFVLGFMTSISEVSVMVNSTINQTPQVSAGNLTGATVVLLMFIIPLLAVIGNGLKLNNRLVHSHLALALIVIALPAFFLSDGLVTPLEGGFSLMGYMLLLYFIRKTKPETVPKVIEEVEKELILKNHPNIRDGMIILGGALAVFLAGHVLVDETVYFSELFRIPSSIIGLLLLGLGTNLPEMIIAVRSVRKHRPEIAFGDYMGSAVGNTIIFSFLGMINGYFAVEPYEFLIAFLFMVVAFPCLFFFARSQWKLTRVEGSILLGMYVLFLVVQMVNVAGVIGK